VATDRTPPPGDRRLRLAGEQSPVHLHDGIRCSVPLNGRPTGLVVDTAPTEFQLAIE
jgi:hypothetical protein